MLTDLEDAPDKESRCLFVIDHVHLFWIRRASEHSPQRRPPVLPGIDRSEL